MSMQIVTGNRLRDGQAVWLTQTGNWAEQVSAARLWDEPDADATLTALATTQVGLDVIDIQKAPAIADHGVAVPASHRERIRSLGPSVRTDLGKQAHV